MAVSICVSSFRCGVLLHPPAMNRVRSASVMSLTRRRMTDATAALCEVASQAIRLLRAWPEPLPIAVLVSGTGTNLQALLDTVHGREAQVVAVASSVAGAPALERARGARRANAVFAARRLPRPRGARRGAWPTGCASGARAWSCSPATWSCSARPSSRASPARSSTCTPRCCRPSPGCTRSSRRSPTA